MTRIALLLLVALVLSALAMVRTAYDERTLFTRVEDARSQARQLDQEYLRLDAELRAQSNSLRVERTARERLAMRSPTPGVTVFVSDAQAVAAAASAASAPGNATLHALSRFVRRWGDAEAQR